MDVDYCCSCLIVTSICLGAVGVLSCGPLWQLVIEVIVTLTVRNVETFSTNGGLFIVPDCPTATLWPLD